MYVKFLVLDTFGDFRNLYTFFFLKKVFDIITKNCLRNVA